MDVVVVADAGTIFIGLLLWKQNLLTTVKDVILIVILTLTVSETTAINLSSCYKLSVVANMQSSRFVFTARLRPQFRMPRSFDRCTPPRRRFNQNIPPTVVLLQQCHCRNRHRGKLQNLSPPSVLFEWSRIFLQYTGDTDAKNDGPEF